MSDLVNLPEALKGEAQRIFQLFQNVGVPQLLPTGSTPVPWYDWPDRQTIHYYIPGAFPAESAVRLRFQNIRVKDFGPIEWSKEEVVSDQTVNTVITGVDVPAGTDFDQTITHTFKGVTTLSESTTQGFEAAAKASFGPEYAHFDIEGKVKRESTQAFGNEKTYEESISQRIAFKGPRNVSIQAVREEQKLRRRVQSTPIFDYIITLSANYTLYLAMGWDSKAELLDFLRGNAPDSAGQLLPFRYEGGSRAGFPPTVQAPYFRAHPQKDADIPPTGQPLEWTSEYITVQKQTIVAKDV